MATNLLKLIDYSGTQYGVRYVRNSESGTIKLDGTVSGGFRQRIGSCFFPSDAAVTIDGFPGPYFFLQKETGEYYTFPDTGQTYHSLPHTITLNGLYYVSAYYQVNAEYSNDTFYPMIRYADSPDTTFEPFKKNNQVIVVGDTVSPLLTLQNSQIESCQEETAVSLVGDELFIDSLTPVVHYQVFPQLVFKPRNYDGILTSDDLVFCGHFSYDLRTLPYGTKLSYYIDSIIQAQYFVKNVERTGRYQYKINGISTIGLLNRQIHKGGMYTGQLFGSVIGEIMNGLDCYLASEVASIPVYGWLPYSTRRRNLHQLLMAYGVTITRHTDGIIYFRFLDDSEAENIPDDRLFIEGTVEYDEPASRVEVTEHTFHYLPDVEEVVLFDNTSEDTVTGALITFDQPIYASSLHTDGEGSLTITSSGVNYAYVSGVGILYGKPYVHTTRVLSKENSEATAEHVVTVEEATLVTVQNSLTVLDRLSEYYFNSVTLKQDILRLGEKCGKQYNLKNVYHEYAKGFITRMSTKATSIRRAECEIRQGYTPNSYGVTYSHREVIPVETGRSGGWMLHINSSLTPVSLFAAQTFRFVLIGYGEDGEDGEDGFAGESATENESGKGGLGGAGGGGGRGGKIFSVTIKTEDLVEQVFGGYDISLWFEGVGKNTVMTCTVAGAQTTYTSADGVSSNVGYFDVLGNEVFALPGSDGVAGGAGGKGGYKKPNVSREDSGESGETVTWRDHDYYGGSGGEPSHHCMIEIYNSGRGSENLFIYGSGGGGGGASAGNNGENGTGWEVVGTYGDDPLQRLQYANCGGKGGDGADGLPTSTQYGSGGNGGNGGAGGGGAGLALNYNEPYHTLIYTYGGTPGQGGSGGTGSAGRNGCAIIYY